MYCVICNREDDKNDHVICNLTQEIIEINITLQNILYTLKK